MITIFQPYESDHVYDNNVAHLPMRLDDNLAQVIDGGSHARYIRVVTTPC